MKQLSTGTGHIVRVETSFIGSITVFYDGKKIATGSRALLGGANCMFQITENNQLVTYECSTRVALAMDDHLTVRRNGVVIYTD